MFRPEADQFMELIPEYHIKGARFRYPELFFKFGPKPDSMIVTDTQDQNILASIQLFYLIRIAAQSPAPTRFYPDSRTDLDQKSAIFIRINSTSG